MLARRNAALERRTAWEPQTGREILDTFVLLSDRMEQFY